MPSNQIVRHFVGIAAFVMMGAAVAVVYLLVVGRLLGRGGDGFSGADAGNGADASLVDAVFGPSAQLLAQNATGGNGGSSQGGAVGRGGSATSQFAAANATFDQSLEVVAVGFEVRVHLVDRHEPDPPRRQIPSQAAG